MKALLRLSTAIDALNDRIGRAVAWLVVLMTLLATFNAVARYLGRYLGVNLSSNAYLEAQWYLFSLVFLLAAGYTLRQDSHVRVDVLYARVSERARSWINVLGTVLLLMPFSIFVLWVSWPSVRNAWIIRETSPDPGGLPRFPLKPFILVCFVLLLLQGVSELIKEVRALRAHGAPVEHERERALEGL